MINKCKTIARGFTLIETLLAVLLLSTAIAGPLTIASKGTLAAVSAKDQITAFYLAQDAMEFVRYQRDSNCLAAAAAPSACPASGANGWLAVLGSWGGSAWSGTCVSADGSQSCIVDSIQATATACTGACSVINYDSTNGYYSYTSGTPTPQRFVRTIKIVTPFGGNANQARVLITVTWTTAGVQHVVTEKEDMTNWQ